LRILEGPGIVSDDQEGSRRFRNVLEDYRMFLKVIAIHEYSRRFRNVLEDSERFLNVLKVQKLFLKIRIGP